MVDLLTLLGSIGGGITDAISQSSELVVSTNGTTKILTLNLGRYVTNAALTNALAAYTDTTALTTLLGAKQNTLLNAKVNNSQVLTNVPANAVFTDTLYTHPSQHSIGMMTGLQTALDAKQAALSAGAGCFLNGSAISSYTLR